MSKLSAYYVTGFNGFQQFTGLVEGVDNLSTHDVASSTGKRDKKQQNESSICFLSFTRLRYLKYLLFSWSTTFSSETDDEKLVPHGYENLSEHSNPEKQGIFPLSTGTTCIEEHVNPKEEIHLDFAATKYVKFAYPGCPRGLRTVPLTAVAEAINGNVAEHFIITNKEEVFVCNRKEGR